MAQLKRITSILDNCSWRCSIPKPSSWATTTSAAAMELRDSIMFAVADDILERVDPRQPIVVNTTITGDGTSETRTISNTFKRLVKSRYAVFQIGYPTKEFCQMRSLADFEAMKDHGAAGGVTYFLLQEATDDNDDMIMRFYPVLPAGVQVSVTYVSENWIYNGVAPQAVFASDNNRSYLPHRLMEAGINYFFRKREGLDYVSDRAEYESELNRYANESAGVSTVGVDQKGRRWVFDIPVPDIIPPGP